MIKNVLQEIGGIGLYGVISICLFFLVFSAALIRACCLNQQTADSMSALPLEEEPPPHSPTNPHLSPSPSLPTGINPSR